MIKNKMTVRSLYKFSLKKMLLTLAAIAIPFAAMTLANQTAHAELAMTSSTSTTAAPAQKEWTFLLFLNGNNSLDDYGDLNINQMEEVGSTNQLNLVVQWASLARQTTERLLVKKDSDPGKVTSPIVQHMGNVDMGNYKNLVSFVQWGVQNYPAKHYMIAVWNHGNGWHLMNSGNSNFHVNDISFDDNTGNKITTEQLGLAMAESAKIIGHKVDVYGSDACLMAMGEIAAELKNSVSYFVGSEDVEPGYGWPYTPFISRWAKNPSASPRDVSVFITEEYLKSYDGGVYGSMDVTFSSMEMAQFGPFLDSMKVLNTSLTQLSASDLATAKAAADSTQAYTLGDYKDLGDFITRMQRAKVQMNSNVLTDVRQSIQRLIVSGGGTGHFSTAKGISLWIPTQSYELSSYRERYSQLSFNLSTGWLAFLDLINK